MPCKPSAHFAAACAPALRFDLAEAAAAHETRGANCGPFALAAIAGLDLDEARSALPDFPFGRARGTTEAMMVQALDALGLDWKHTSGEAGLPAYGLVRICWRGPWDQDPDPFAPLRHSHWIAVQRCGGLQIFDVNAMAVGGWIPFAEWDEVLVPWLLDREEPQSTGEWRVHDVIAIAPIARRPTAH